jgi:MOSC domain-containing protein YiiM
MTCALEGTGYAVRDAKEFEVTKLIATVVSVHAGSNDDMSKQAHASIDVELDGIVGDAHRSYSRKAWAGDKQPEGTVRRNERQWSAVSVEELAEIQDAMDLTLALTPTELGANLCLRGIRELSRLPKGSVLRFPSGAELLVEEYNPPCHDMGRKLATTHETRSGEPLSSTAFSKAAKLSRGLVGVVEVSGVIKAGDEVQIELYETPSWLIRTAD